MSRLNLNSTLANLRTDFDDRYEFGSIIGRGKYAVVKKCYCKESKRCYAAKVIRKFRAIDNHLKMNIVENEINALKLVQAHPSIVSLYEVFHHKDEIILLLEYATQRDLQPYLGLFDEEVACFIIYQVLKAIEYLHSKNILHLDIKPENVLLMIPIGTKIKTEAKKSKKKSSSDDEEDDDDEEEDEVTDDEVDDDEDDIESSENSDENNNNSDNNDLDEITANSLTIDMIKVKLCDFSFSQVMTTGKKILGMMGTVAYSAPEVLEFDALTKATDMWSLGVLTHVLLTSYTPFGNGNERDLSTQTNILNTRSEPFKCDDSYFENISDEAKKFIEELVIYKPRQRLTVEQALNHEWFKKWDIKSKVAALETQQLSTKSATITTATTTTTTMTTVQNDNNKMTIVKNETVEIATKTTAKEDIVSITVDTDAKITTAAAAAASANNNTGATQLTTSNNNNSSTNSTNSYSYHSHLHQIHHLIHHNLHYNHLLDSTNDATKALSEQPQNSIATAAL